jgi:hypothetical protein
MKNLLGENAEIPENEKPQTMFTFKFECYDVNQSVNGKSNLVKVKVKAPSVKAGQKRAMDLVSRNKYDVVESIEIKK